MIEEMIMRGWENFLTRPEGPLSFRFVVQPAVVAILAARAGLRDARQGRPVYFWAAFTSREYREAFLRKGWRDMSFPLLLSMVLDAGYQAYVHGFIYPLEMIFTGLLLAAVPYLIVRGLLCSIVRRSLGLSGPNVP